MRDISNAMRFKAERKRAGTLACDGCGFVVPEILYETCRHPHKRLLQVHHVQPVQCGGTDDASNFALLCANCHGMAHLHGSTRRGMSSLPEWIGPNTPAELATSLRMCRDQPAEWVTWIRDLAAQRIVEQNNVDVVSHAMARATTELTRRLAQYPTIGRDGFATSPATYREQMKQIALGQRVQPQ